MTALTHHFDPPEGFVGEFGWLCGYSAGIDFMDAALERFTGMTAAVRAHEGAIALVAILDPGNPQISPIDVPGLWHAPYIDTKTKPFRLMHAKVALLGFRHESDGRHLVRLLVSTGNWTRDTLETSIDLAWYAEVSSEEVALHADAALQMRCADLSAAEDLFRTLRRWFDCALVEQMLESETSLRRRRLDDWMRTIRRRANGRSRFLDNREASLLSQLPAKVIDIAGPSTRNRLMMGSGFFEKLGSQDEPAKHLAKIADRLRAKELITRGASIDVFVNLRTCRGLVGLPGSGGWTVREGRWAREPDRSLHAKFIFSGFQQSRSDSCGSAWLYLGSGNLTAPGFLKRCSSGSGNLEAGVVLATPGLEWGALSTHLPVGGSEAAVLCDDDLATEANMLDRGMVFVAAPVYAFRVEPMEGGSRLVSLPSDGSTRVNVKDDAGVDCTRNGDGFFWTGDVPRTVVVSWKVGLLPREARVPTIDTFGRIAGTVLPALQLEDAVDELSNFPLIVEPDQLFREDSFFDRRGSGPMQGTSIAESRYALRRIMELVERVASTQTSLPESEWTRWCLRLQQVLTRTASCETVATARALELDVLSPLFHPAFVPDFVVKEGMHRQKYVAVLDAVRQAWAIDTFPALEVE